MTSPRDSVGLSAPTPLRSPPPLPPPLPLPPRAVSFLDIPVELWHQILAFDDVAEAASAGPGGRLRCLPTHCALSATCRPLREVTESENVWRLRLRMLSARLAARHRLLVRYDDYCAAIACAPQQTRQDQPHGGARAALTWKFSFVHFFLLVSARCVVCTRRETAVNAPFTHLPSMHPDTKGVEGTSSSTPADLSRFPFAHCGLCILCLRDNFVKRAQCIELFALSPLGRALGLSTPAATLRFVRSALVEYRMRGMVLYPLRALMDLSSGQQQVAGPMAVKAARYEGAAHAGGGRGAHPAWALHASRFHHFRGPPTDDGGSALAARAEESGIEGSLRSISPAHARTRTMSLVLQRLYEDQPNLSGRPAVPCDPLGFTTWPGHLRETTTTV